MNKFKSHDEFFENCGEEGIVLRYEYVHDIISPTRITIEEVYQHFKSRMVKEIINDIKLNSFIELKNILRL